MLTAARLIAPFVTRLAQAPAATITRLSDDADEIWEPFLCDVPLVPRPVER